MLLRNRVSAVRHYYRSARATVSRLLPSGVLLFFAAAPCSIFPFRLARQSKTLAALIAQFTDKFLGIIPTDLFHRVVVSLLNFEGLLPMIFCHCPWVTSVLPIQKPSTQTSCSRLLVIYRTYSARNHTPSGNSPPAPKRTPCRSQDRSRLYREQDPWTLSALQGPAK